MRLAALKAYHEPSFTSTAFQIACKMGTQHLFCAWPDQNDTFRIHWLIEDPFQLLQTVFLPRFQSVDILIMQCRSRRPC